MAEKNNQTILPKFLVRHIHFLWVKFVGPLVRKQPEDKPENYFFKNEKVVVKLNTIFWMFGFRIV